MKRTASTLNGSYVARAPMKSSSLLCRAYAGPGEEVLHTEHGFLMYPNFGSRSQRHANRRTGA